ncbi:HET-domain-containing protein [Hyaloscypha hepaticicola]|uniref:HET-domain-containing protein n=1 Tax=Hyaloscypha hepaticicola TaxID=2082293 RepID=A0A2J6Q8N0_9HELO|nr:HET-domain-containing protein [Hyaloscypha hepaticicola]
MPRRLVELDSATKVRVVEVQQDIPYVVLSYCWGGDQLKLLSSNTSTFTSQEGPELLELSQSVRDAVCVTWNLGLRYLWVDALCIIQDDGTDLASELAKMADIYEGALFTIAAGSVARCSEGFLHQRRLQDTFRISIEDTQGYQGSLLLQNTRVKFAAEALDPIVLRAWTFQEVLLSSRLLYFGLEKLEWSCAAHGGDLSDGGSPSHIHFPRYRWRQLPEMGHTSSVARVESYWANVLTDYTKRALTVPSDKLVALSAVAQRFAERARGGSYLTYLAGIWLEHLPFGLLWYNDNDDDASESQSHPTSRASSWRAPSWSWASMDGPLNFFRLANGDSGQSKLDMNGPLEIINYRVQLKFDNAPYAGVVKAELELTGLLKHVNLDYHSGALEIKLDPDGQLDVGTWPEEIYWDEPPSPDNLEKYSRVLLLEIISPWRNNDLDGEPNEYIMWTLILAEKENGMCYPFDC